MAQAWRAERGHRAYADIRHIALSRIKTDLGERCLLFLLRPLSGETSLLRANAPPCACATTPAACARMLRSPGGDLAPQNAASSGLSIALH